MKPLFFLLVFLILLCRSVSAQTAEEADIRRLEQQEMGVLQKGDTAALAQLWAKEFVVNNPYGQIVTVPQIFGFIRSGQIDYATVERKVERVTIVENIAVAMGKEIVTPQKSTDNAGKTVTRQYTNIWMKRNGSWRMVARQATIIHLE
ncbi:MAG TPA: nuclear transport factor 2 family protein [Chitinophagaceae bacterium]|jgi:ketosteroid isomerase-like protein|nr:nuclear transport factor 2 family protein [Chitinophagaceae bacterium]